MKLSTFFDLLKEDTTETRIIRNGNTIDMSAIGNHVYYNSEIESIRIADDDIIEISVKPGGGASMFTTEQKDMYITFKSLARATARSLTDMAELWERMETDTQILPLCGDSYPFEGSFDDVAFQFAYWVTDFQADRLRAKAGDHPIYNGLLFIGWRFLSLRYVYR